MLSAHDFKNSFIGLLTLTATIGALASWGKPYAPIVAAAGIGGGGYLLPLAEASKSKRQRQIEREAAESKARLEREREEFERQKQQATQAALVHVNQREQQVQLDFSQKTEFINAAIEEVNQQEDYLNRRKAKLDEATNALNQRAFDMQKWLESEHQRSIAIAVKTLEENRQLKKPDKVEHISYEDGVANEIIYLFYEMGIIVKKPFVRPFDDGKERGFKLTFTILPATPDLLGEGKEKLYVQSLGEAQRKIERELLTDIQSKVYACDRLPTLRPVYDGLELTIYLNHFLGQYKAPKEDEPKYDRALISEHGFAGAIANEVLDYCASKNIRMHFVDCYSIDESEVLFWAKPEFQGKLHKIQDVLDDFESQLKSKTRLHADVEGEYVSILWTADIEEFVKVRDQEGKEIVIEEPEDLNWFVNVVTDPKSVHHLIHGPTGSGKSVMFDNICCVAGDNLSAATGKPVSIHLCDPKYPDTEWTYKGERLRPQYPGWDGALEGVLAMNQEVSARLEEAKAIADSVPDELFKDPNYTIPYPERVIQLWGIDEAAALHERYEKQVGPAIRETAWVARSTLIKMVLIGQNPNCSNYGLQIPDLSNFVRWYLGITALEALDRVVKPTRERKAYLKAQIYARLRLVKQKKLAGIANPKEQYFALIWVTNEEPFIAQLPPPKAYANGAGSAVIAAKSESLEDLIEEAKQQEIERLNQLLEKSPEDFINELIETLPSYMKEVINFASTSQDWITSSTLKAKRFAFKKVDKSVIQGWFRELERMGLGEVLETRQTVKFRYPPKAPLPPKGEGES